LFALLAAIGVLGCIFLPWYEADWTYIPFDVEGLGDYDLTWFTSQEAIFRFIQVMTIISAGLAVIFGFVGRAIEPKKGELEKAN